MLCQFTVSNYKCFKDSVTLDLQTANITEHQDSVLQSKDGETFLPLAVVYGPNGAGKSSILDAIYSLARRIMVPIGITLSGKSDEPVIHTEITPYKFSEESKKSPTKFEIFFRTENYEYQYIIHFLKDKVIYEELNQLELSGGAYVNLFIREKTMFKLNGAFKNILSTSGISEKLPLLSLLGYSCENNEIVRDVILWFNDKFNYINYGNPQRESRVLLNSAYKPLVLKMLSEMDIDVVDYRIKKDITKEVYTKHIVDGQEYELKLYQESSGTIKLFTILNYVANAIVNGATLLIDELDSKLHPSLLKYIVELFSNPEINKNKAQLIFTSHDLSNMNSSVFRRDEIWFVAKGNNQSSMLYSLIEIKNSDGTTERKDASYSKRYLEGKYGADPYLRKIINWGEEL